MNIQILIDNLPHPAIGLNTEHGLSLYFEVNGTKFLMDTGDSGLFAKNAAVLGIDIAQVDYLILSHAHHDHTGGLETFLQLNQKAPIFLSEHIADTHYYSLRTGLMRDISLSHALLREHPERFVSVRNATFITPEVRILSPIDHLYPLPYGNRILFANHEPDDFRHEIAVSVKTKQGLIVLSSCSHHGLLNTLHACESNAVIAYVGGTHLLDSQGPNIYETVAEVEEIAQTLLSRYPQLHLYTGHCTGLQAQSILTKTMDGKCTVFHSGFSVRLPD